MRKHLTNAVCGFLDYASYPVGMLLVAPIILHRLGAAEYGLWMIATSAVSAGGIIASGFCDASIQRVAHLRGIGEASSLEHTVRGILGINLVLGFMLAAGAWVAAPYAASHIATSNLPSWRECVISLRIASVLILVRSVESVGVSTQRAFEQYRSTVQISAIMRLLTLSSAAVLAISGRRTVSILMTTGIFLLLGATLQFHGARKFLGDVSLRPTFQSDETRILLKLGVFVWLQAVGGVIFGQLDRILLGIYLGAAAVAPYSLCVQFAHPLFGATASGLHFLFPYLSGRAETISNITLRQTVLKAFLCNLLLVVSGASALLLFGNRLILLWAGAPVAQNAARIFKPIILASALMGLSVTGTYAMQALSLFRTVALITLASRAAMLLLMIYLLNRFGLQGLATARVCYGVAALSLYLPLAYEFRIRGKISSPVTSMGISQDI